MRTRLFACLLAFLLLTASAASATGLADVEHLMAISQQDSRFRSLPYHQTNFGSGGCGPSSITNAFLASLGVTDDAIAADVTREMLDLLCYPANPADTAITIGRMARLASEKPGALDRWPAIQQLMTDYPGHVYFTEDRLDVPDVARYASTPGETLLMIGRLTDNDHWARICQITNMLYYGGYADSAVTLSYLSAGTTGTEGAFRSGKSGHFVTLYIPVREFTEKGNAYLMDSLPRALEGEAFGEGEVYRDAYDFHSQDASDADMYGFRSSIRPQRVSPTIIRLTPQGDSLLKFRSVLSKADPADPASLQALNDARVAYLQTTRLMGTSVMFIAMYPDAQ